jgi:hypothetical protein
LIVSDVYADVQRFVSDVSELEDLVAERNARQAIGAGGVAPSTGEGVTNANLDGGNWQSAGVEGDARKTNVRGVGLLGGQDRPAQK